MKVLRSLAFYQDECAVGIIDTRVWTVCNVLGAHCSSYIGRMAQVFFAGTCAAERTASVHTFLAAYRLSSQRAWDRVYFGGGFLRFLHEWMFQDLLKSESVHRLYS